MARRARPAPPLTIILARALLAFVLAGTATAQEQPDAGHFPFFPSRQTTPDGAPVSLDGYASNEQCLGCHVEIAQQWKGSMHSFAFTDPVFRALYEEASRETEGRTDALCMGCHSSPAILSGSSSPEEVLALGRPATEGVSCVVCHSISGSNLPVSEGVHANASFVSDPTGPIFGPTGRSCLAEGKATVKSALHGRSEFCANCHGVVRPDNGFAVEGTYEEWRGSIYAARGFQCQDCHMQPLDKVIESVRTLEKVLNPGTVAGKARDHVYTHGFTGGSSALLGFLGAEEHAANSRALLEAAASLELLLPERAAIGELVPLRIKVNNELAGHNLPTSLVQLRQMWLDVRVADADGDLIYHSGRIDEQGDIDPDAVMFTAITGDASGKPTTKPWEMTQYLYEHTVPPRGFTMERLAFAIPQGSTEPITVTATLRYRSFPQRLVDRLLGEDAPTIDPVDMTSTVATVLLKH